MSGLSASAATCGCGRILFPTADNRWPPHLEMPVGAGKWCPRSDLPMRRSKDREARPVVEWAS